MSNYGRNTLWDAATWADLDQAVSEEVARVRVARKIFRTEDLLSADGTAPPWVSAAPIKKGGAQIGRFISDGDARPFVEISVVFSLTPAQAEAEDTLHTGRTLARAAAKYLALSEDHIVLRGDATEKTVKDWGVATRNARGLKGLTGVEPAPSKLKHEVDAPRDSHKEAQALVDTVNSGITELAAAGWSAPYALILSPGLYTNASKRLHDDSEETPIDRLTPKLRHTVLSGALAIDTGVLVSLAGDATTIYTAGDASIVFSGEELADDGAFYRFRVFERIQYAVTDTTCIRLIPPVTEKSAGPPGGGETNKPT